jgi:homoserine kinase type II
MVDFGAMAIESVAADLARLLGDWVGPDRVQQAVALEAYNTIRPLDAFEIALIEVIAGATALLGAGRWVCWHFLEGRRFHDPSAVARGIERGVQRLVEWTTAREGTA